MAEDGYSRWIDRLGHTLGTVDLIRLDHFRGFAAYWEVPAAAEVATNGRWIDGPGRSFFDAISSALGGLPFVAEDLGVITPEVDALRLGQGLPGMVVLQFEVGDASFDMDGIAQNSVCYTGTHDNDTTLGWFLGTGNDTRSEDDVLQSQTTVLKKTGGTAETIQEDMIRLAFSSNSTLAVAPMQDFLGLGSEARINTPGTTRDNWRWRMKEGALDSAMADRVAGMVEEASRQP